MTAGSRVDTENMRVADVISGREGLRGVRWLLLSRESLDRIRGTLSGMLLSPESLGDCRLTRAKFSAGHKLTAYFDVSLRTAEGARIQVRPVVVTWCGEKNNMVGENAESIQDEAKRRDVCAPFRELSADGLGWNMRVKVAPFDISFPELVRLSDPIYAGEVLDTQGCVPEVSWLRYRPGRRHVLRYQLPSPNGSRSVFLKLYGAGHARSAYEDSVKISDWPSFRGSGVACLRPICFLEGDSAVVYSQACGILLSTHYGYPNPLLARLLERTGAALRLLQSAPATLVRSRRRNFANHVEMIASTVAHRAPLLPSAANALPEFLERARRVHERIGSEPEEVFAHGDIKAEHIYAADHQLTLIDFDCRCLADPAYDPGKFMADLDLRLSSFGAAIVEQAQAHFLAGYAPDSDELVRIRLWHALMMAYLGWRRVAWFDSDPAALLASALSRAERVLCLAERT
jgi:phosphotransferase family enzyme